MDTQKIHSAFEDKGLVLAAYQGEIERCFDLAQRLDASNPTLAGAFTGTPSVRIARQLAALKVIEIDPSTSVTPVPAADPDEHPAARRMRDRFEEKYGVLSTVFSAIQRWRHKVEEFDAPYNRDREVPVTEDDVEQVEQRMLRKIALHAAAGRSTGVGPEASLGVSEIWLLSGGNPACEAPDVDDVRQVLKVNAELAHEQYLRDTLTAKVP